MDERRDRLTALIVDAALHTCGTHGVEAAALSMEQHGVARETILRVLTRPRQRRGVGQWVVQPQPAGPAENSTQMPSGGGGVHPIAYGR